MTTKKQKNACVFAGFVLFFSLILLFCINYAKGASSGNRERTDIPHLKKTATATQLIVGNEPFVMLAGELHNSSSSNLEYLEPVWNKLVLLNLNTVLAAVTWQSVEPEEGKFDFTLLDGLIAKAREHDLRLVLLWFGTWKNTISCYVPDWVKKDRDRFKHAQRKSPRKLRPKWGFGEKLEVISPLCREARDADKRAFAAMMRHIHKVDADKHTVIMIQVENETGLLGDSRDRSAPAEKAFGQPVPKELIQYLQRHKGSLIPELHTIWARTGFRTSGMWTEVFGEGPDTDEIFMAWHVGRYVDEIAKAGKAEYPLPMFVNTWLMREELNELPGEYPSGGPVSKMMDIWRAAAPSIDLIAPDIYWPYFKTVCAKYTRSDNPLLIPEANRDTEPERKVFYAIAEHDAICFAPFGIDNQHFEPEHPLGQSYKLLSSLMHLITKCHGTEKIRGFLQYKEKGQAINIGDYRFNISYNREPEQGHSGCGLIIALAPDEFLIAGLDFVVSFGSNNKDLPHAGILSIQEGRFEEARWIPGRWLNGDENGHGTDLGFLSELATERFPVRKVRLYCFKQ